MRKFTIGMLLIAMLAVMAAPAFPAAQIKETNILTWNGSAWIRLTKGQIYSDVTSATTAATMAIGGGYGAAGLSVAATGALTSNSTAQFDGVITSGITGSNGGLTIKSTGAGGTTFSVAGATGNTATTGALDVTGAVTIGAGGNGYTTSGTTITALGAISTKGALIVDGTSTLTGATTITGALTQTGAVTCASTLTAKRKMATDISGATATLAVATTPSGSVQTISAATCAVTLPALTAGVTYTFIMLGDTSFTLTGPSACLLCDSIATAKTNLVWTTAPVNLCVTVISTASNWVVTSFTAAPDSSS